MFVSSLVLSAIGAFAAIGNAESTPPNQHNIVFIILDDLDARMTGQEIMPSLKKHVIDQGTTYSRHYCTVSLCCPARATILTGQNAHNHNVTNVTPPEGTYCS
jgi:N-acetylglucosamine-6-sulfatase